MVAAPGIRRHLAWVGVGGLDIAVPAEHLRRALHPMGPLHALPRRRGAVAGLLPLSDGVVPVVDLGRWLKFEATPAAAAPEATAPELVLLLCCDGRQLGVVVSRVMGVADVETTACRRVHHGNDEEELFDSVVDWPQGPAGMPLLEVGRLMALLGTWIDTGDLAGAAGALESGPTGERSGLGMVVCITGRQVWLPAQLLREIVPAAQVLAREGAAAGGWQLGWWRGLPLPLARLSLQGRDASAPDPGQGYVAVLGEAAQGALGLQVDSLDRLCHWPQQGAVASGADAPWSAFVDAVGVDATGQPILRLDVAALLAAHPESRLSLGQEGRPAALQGGAADPAGVLNVLPYIVFEAGALRCIGADRVLEIVPLRDPGPQGLNWRGRWVPLLDQVPDEERALVMVVQSAAGPVGRIIRGLRQLVPAGRGRLHRWERPGGKVIGLLTLMDVSPPMVVQAVDW